MTTKPEIIIVPGAWHGPSSFDPTTKLLEKAGYQVHGISLASVGASPQLQNFDADVDIIKRKVNEVLSTGKDAVLVYHSYGSVPGSEALKEYLESLEKGRKEGWGKVRRLVFCCAFILAEGGSLMKGLGGNNLPWFDVNDSKDTVNPMNPQEIFYNDLSPSQAASYISDLKTHSYATFASEQTVAPWKVIPSTYIFCEKDNAILPPWQEGLIAMAKGMAPNSFDVVERVDASHSPFISQPEWLAKKIEEAAK